jgi:hypothetical protein
MLLLGLLLQGTVSAHGLWGHIHVTGWAVENMPDDELRAFLLEPEVFNALLSGAMFTDTGYALDDGAARAYSEHTHWEPFIEDFVEWIQVNDPPPWDSVESRKRVAFLMGCGSHGLQDTLFDSLFLYQIEEHDGAGQDEADPGTDGFLVLDGHVRFVPEADLPMDTLLELYADLDQEITEELIDRAVSVVTAAYINDGGGLTVAETLGNRYAPDLPWARIHYLDPEIPGSLRAEIYPTMRYQQALWARLHGTLAADDVTTYAFPEPPRRLRSADAETVDSWTSLVFGAGVRYEEGLVDLTGPDGEAVPFTQGNTRWNAGYTRLVRLMPSDDLEPGGWYTARLLPGAELIDGEQTAEPWELTFQVDCDEASAEECDEPVDFDVARIDGILAEEEAAPAEDGCGCSSTSGRPALLVLSLVMLFGILRRSGARVAWSRVSR